MPLGPLVPGPLIRRLAKSASMALGAPSQQWMRKRYFWYLHAHGVIHEPEMDHLSRFVRSGDTVLDVGANTGLYTVLLSGLVGGDGKVHAFEPIPEMFEVLSYVTNALGLSNVRLHNCADDHRSGMMRMVVPFDATGDKNYYLAHLETERGGAGEVLMVPATTVDALREQERSRVAFIKCDSEGSEALVLAGAGKVLESDRPVLMLEVCRQGDRTGEKEGAIFEWIKAQGFIACKPEGKSLVACDTPSGPTVNFFFIPRERASSCL